MSIEQMLSNLEGHEWLVTARNMSQSLLLRLLQRWGEIEKSKRPAALSAAFSLWRAVFLLLDKDREQAKREEEKEIETVDRAAKKFLAKVIETNAITFGDDMARRYWTSVYYVENAMYRITDLTGHVFVPRGSSPPSTVRTTWNEAFAQLDAFVPGTLPGTLDRKEGDPADRDSAG